MDNVEGPVNYVATPDIIDNLKLELSVASPQEDSRVQQTASEIVTTLRHDFDRFIPEATNRKTKGIENRVIIVEKDALKKFDDAWHGEENSPGGFGLHTTKGNIILVAEPKAYWDAMNDKAKPQLIADLGGENRARQLVGQWGMVGTLAHEIAHVYQDHGLPLWFSEGGAYYYQRVITNKLKYEHLIDHRKEEIRSMYEKLVDKFGDDVHKTFFGSQQDRIKSQEILAGVQQEQIDRLFPKPPQAPNSIPAAIKTPPLIK